MWARARLRPSATVLALAIGIVALVAVLAGNGLRDGGAVTAVESSPALSSSSSGVVAATVGDGEHDAASVTTVVDVAPVAGQTAEGVLLPVQLAPSARALARVGANGRLLAVVLGGLLLTIIGRRPRTRRPILVPIPVAAAPGLRVRRRGPPAR